MDLATLFYPALSALSDEIFPWLQRNAEMAEMAGLDRSFPAARTEGTVAPGAMSSQPLHHICEETKIGPGLPS